MWRQKRGQAFTITVSVFECPSIEAAVNRTKITLGFSKFHGLLWAQKNQITLFLFLVYTSVFIFIFIYIAHALEFFLYVSIDPVKLKLQL